jgi:hypothetical protein
VEPESCPQNLSTIPHLEEVDLWGDLVLFVFHVERAGVGCLSVRGVGDGVGMGYGSEHPPAPPSREEVWVWKLGAGHVECESGGFLVFGVEC